jgi:hypothetical protein
MQATFHGGPYDGVVLDHNDINLYTRFLPVGIRKFVLMPPLKDWEAVRRGEKDKDSQFEDACPVYELVRTTHGMEGRFDADGSIFAEASREYSEGRQPVPQVEFTGQYFKCYRGDLQDVPLPEERFLVTDEKDREWVCFPVSKEEGETGGFAEMLSRLGGKPSDQPLRLVILHCIDRSELPAKLADQLD